jgi:hypothetical protein
MNRQALDIYSKILGEAHPQTAYSYHFLSEN